MELKEKAAKLYDMASDMDFMDYEEFREEEIRTLAGELQKAKDSGLDSLFGMLELICM